MRYRAFLSYSRSDEGFARRLHSTLEQYRAPRGIEVAGLDGRRLGSIYRDDQEMPAVPDLGIALREALDQSENLIVLCSPQAAASRWVNSEIVYFSHTKQSERVFPVVVDGRPEAEDPLLECLPPALRAIPASEQPSVLPSKRYWLDARKESFQRLVVRLVAGLLGVGFDHLWQREKRRTRFRRIRIAAVTLLLLLTLVGVGIRQGRERARRESALLASASRLATSHAFSAALEDDRGSNLERALRLGLLAARRSWRSPAAPDAFPSLMRAAVASPVLTAGAGHTGPIRAIALSADGSRLVTASSDGTASTWETRSARRLESLELDQEPTYVEWVDEAILMISHEGSILLWQPSSGTVESLFDGIEILAAALSADRRLLVTGHSDGTVRLWDSVEGMQIADLVGHTGPVVAVAVTAKGSWIATGGVDGTARVWNASTGEALAVFQVHEDWVSTVALSADGSRLLTSAGSHLLIWEVSTGRRLATLTGASDEITRAFFSPDGTRVAATGLDRAVHLWSSEGGAPILVVESDQHFSSLTFLADGERLLTTSEDGTARLWEADSGREMARLEGHQDPITVMAMSADERHLVTAGRDSLWRLWDLSAGQPLLTFQGHKAQVRAVAVSPDDHLVASAGADGVRVWELATGVEIIQLPVATGSVTSVQFLAGGRLMTAGSNGIIEFWEPPGSTPLSRIPVQPFAWFHAAVSPDGSLVAAPLAEPAGVPEYNGTTWVIHEVSTGAEVAHFETHFERVNSVAFSPEGATLVTASRDGTACLWRTLSGERVLCLEGHEGVVTSAAFSPDGRWIVTGGLDSSARIWDAATGRERGPPLMGHQGALLAAVFSPDQTRVATAGHDNTARIWDVATGLELVRLSGHRSLVNGVAFASGGKALLTASFDGTVNLWDITWSHACATSPTGCDADGVEYLRRLCDPRAGKLRGALAKLTAGDAEVVPLLANRVGENVCHR